MSGAAEQDGASGLAFRERPADGEPAGVLVLHHGRGTSEDDLIGLADALDPGRRLHVAAPRGPLTLAALPGFHWYEVERVGHPDHDSFHASRRALAAFHDGLWERAGLGPGATVLGGFSMGAVMSYALGLDGDRPAPAGVLALSGFVPQVDGWGPHLSDRPALRAFVAHGRNDPVIPLAFAHEARDILGHGAIELDYRESDAGHHVDPDHVRPAADWLAAPLRVG